MSEVDAWGAHRVEYYNKLIESKFELLVSAVGGERDSILADIKLLQDAVSRIEVGAPPPEPVKQKEYYVEPEDDGCAGGACKI